MRSMFTGKPGGEDEEDVNLEEFSDELKTG